MATLFEPSLSASAMRPPLATASASSMADSLPNLNFGFEDLRARMAAFTDRFDAFIAQGHKRVLEERNQFRINVAGLQEDQRTKTRDIETLAQKSSQHSATLSTQEAETKAARDEITAITASRNANAQHRDRLRTEINSCNKNINQHKAAQAVHAERIDEQAKLNVPELNFWETYLGLRIEGAGRVDRLKFIFSNLDERECQKEAWFELDTEKRDYKVIACKPNVEEGDIEACVDKLNESRDLGEFLKVIREVFVQNMRRT
ncbi:kinetochore-associated Ndc80 complex subunit spc25 [Lecanora helva]